MKRIIALVAVCLFVWFALRDAKSGTTSGTASGGVSVTPASATAPSVGAPTGGATGSTTSDQNRMLPVPASTSGRGFENRSRLDEHFAKHGGEFGSISPAQYLTLAQTLRDERAGGDVLEIVRPDDGVVSRFDKRSGAFIAFNRDGTIRTFFKPNDGERYFRRQANRAPLR